MDSIAFAAFLPDRLSFFLCSLSLQLLRQAVEIFLNRPIEKDAQSCNSLVFQGISPAAGSSPMALPLLYLNENLASDRSSQHDQTTQQ